MVANVSEDCIGCGMCEGVCGDVFQVGDDGLAHAVVDEVPEELVADAQEAAEGCPVSAITVE